VPRVRAANSIGHASDGNIESMVRNKKMTTLSIAIALLVFAFIVGVWWYVFFGQANLPLPQTRVSIQSSSSTAGTASTTVVDGENPTLPEEPLGIDAATFNVEVASTAIEQARGLSFRPSLGADDGMLFVFATGSVQTFWMKDMNFPLDMIWISGDTVAGFTTAIPAPASGTPLWELNVYPSPPNVDKVLEVNSGTVAVYNIKVGDIVNLGLPR